MKLWDKGISIDKKIEQFTVGNDREIDIHIAKYDVIASRAHAKMLQKIGIISVEELVDLLSGLKVLETQIEEGTFDKTLYEDIQKAESDSEIYENLLGFVPETDIDLSTIGNPRGYGNVVDEFRIYVDGELYKTV